MQRSFKKEITDESLKKEMTKEFLSYYSKNIDMIAHLLGLKISNLG